MRPIDADALIEASKTRDLYLVPRNGKAEVEGKLYETSAVELINEQPTIESSEWIVCKGPETYPKNGVYVNATARLRTDSRNRTFSAKHFINPVSHYGYWILEGYGYVEEKLVKAWMPLPEPMED